MVTKTVQVSPLLQFLLNALGYEKCKVVLTSVLINYSKTTSWVGTDWSFNHCKQGGVCLLQRCHDHSTNSNNREVWPLCRCQLCSKIITIWLCYIVVTFMLCLTVFPNTDWRGVICIVWQLQLVAGLCLTCAKFNRSLSCENILSCGRKHVRFVCPLLAPCQHQTDKKLHH